MLDFISNCKQKIIKYKKQFFTFALIPVFMFRTSFSSFAFTSYDNFPFDSSYLESVFFTSSETVYSDGELNEKNIFVFDNQSLSISKILFALSRTDYVYDLPVNVELFDYYIVSSVYANAQDILNFTFFPSELLCYYRNHDGVSVQFPLSDVNYYHVDTDSFKGFSSSCKIDFSQSSVIEYFGFSSSSYLTVPAGVHFQFSVIALPKGLTSGDISQSVVNAINNQTNSIMNVGSGFGGTTSGILSGNDELSGFIDDYTEIEQSMYDKFTENQSAVIGNFSGFSWGSLSTAVDWTSDYLNRIYDNSGDFRTMFMYPILAGIALIFIGRQGLTAYVRSRREK